MQANIHTPPSKSKPETSIVPDIRDLIRFGDSGLLCCRGRGSCCFGAPSVSGDGGEDDEEWEDAADRMANDVMDDGGDGRCVNLLIRNHDTCLIELNLRQPPWLLKYTSSLFRAFTNIAKQHFLGSILSTHHHLYKSGLKKSEPIPA